MADVLADAQRWLDSLATRTDAVEAAQDAVWVIEQSITEIERLRRIEAAAEELWRLMRTGHTDSEQWDAKIALCALLKKDGTR